jgi:hypothetical protein
MWPFKKKKPEAPKKKLVMKWRNTVFNVGKTTVKLTFADGRRFSIWVYGECDQYINSGWNDGKPSCSPVHVVTSLMLAQRLIKDIGGNDRRTYVDDPKCPQKSASGLLRAAEILHTVVFEETFGEAYLEEEA